MSHTRSNLKPLHAARMYGLLRSLTSVTRHSFMSPSSRDRLAQPETSGAHNDALMKSRLRTITSP